MQVLYWLALGVLAYAYGGYLLVLVAIDAARRLRTTVRMISAPTTRDPSEVRAWPKVSVLIAAHDEAAVIDAKLANTFALDYPRDRLEVLVGSDGSTDGTDERVLGWSERGVRLSAAPRAGKASVLDRLARVASGTLWLFTDANTLLEPGALRRLVVALRGPSIGAACGRLRLVPPRGGPSEESVYWRFESVLKAYESRCGTIVGANGGLYLLRASEWRSLPADAIVDDFLVTMRVVAAGRRVVYVPEAVAVETTSDASGEFRRRTRIAAGNYRALRELWPVLVRLDFGGFALWSHKVARWLGPSCLVAALVANVALASRPVYAVLLALQLSAYALASVEPPSLGRFSRLVRHFLLMNAALGWGFVQAVRGQATATWQRTERAPGAERAA